MRLLRNLDAIEIIHGNFGGLFQGRFTHQTLGNDKIAQNGHARKQIEAVENHADLTRDCIDVLGLVGKLMAVDEDIAAGMLFHLVDAADPC